MLQVSRYQLRWIRTVRAGARVSLLQRLARACLADRVRHRVRGCVNTAGRPPLAIVTQGRTGDVARVRVISAGCPHWALIRNVSTCVRPAKAV